MLGPRRSTAAIRIAMTLALALANAACASFSRDGGMDAVSAIAATELNKDVGKIDSDAAAAAARARVRTLLASALSADAAVQIALLNNKQLQAAYNELGIAE